MVDAQHKKPDIEEFFSFLQNAFHPLDANLLDSYVRNPFDHDGQGGPFRCLITLVPYEALPLNVHEVANRKPYVRPVLIRPYRTLRFASNEGYVCKLTPESSFTPIETITPAYKGRPASRRYISLNNYQKSTVLPLNEKNFSNQVVVQLLDSLETDLDVNSTRATLSAVDPNWLCQVSNLTCSRKSIANLCIQYGSQIYYDPSYRNAYEIWSNSLLLAAFIHTQRALILPDLFSISIRKSLERFHSQSPEYPSLPQPTLEIQQEDTKPPLENRLDQQDTTNTFPTKKSPSPNKSDQHVLQNIAFITTTNVSPKSPKHDVPSQIAKSPILQELHLQNVPSNDSTEEEQVESEPAMDEEQLNESSDSEEEFTELLDFLNRKKDCEEVTAQRDKLFKARSFLESWQKEWKLLDRAINNAQQSTTNQSHPNPRGRPPGSTKGRRSKL
ncbi:uncharacterized protein SOCG_03996 [Schizosaccharomyces octosporus yFS286]|uniref:Uncharacterized protein n=1 Tax=Schizosaccharomyces octosporus (strain yFS286) TaxID=483514 RepID=S9RDA9_SCHOY|nr:uncharacterized protein SOCG_03996 [Schizosaccharomyces octosporus yFS286]EPX72064.1 hypothetical protein SOCG_03996 [Schizosaccharomyces octosporus yFS286]